MRGYLETRHFMNLVNGSIIFKPVWKSGMQDGIGTYEMTIMKSFEKLVEKF